MTVDLDAWTDWHRLNAPWCDSTTCGSHTVRLNGPDLVNGRPDGPIAHLLGYSTTWLPRQTAAADRWHALVDQLLEAAGPAATGRR